MREGPSRDGPFGYRITAVIRRQDKARPAARYIVGTALECR
jgi:hypothetical protein